MTIDRPNQLRRLRRRAGLSLVEVMFGVLIAAGLLTAAAVAFNASSDVIQTNDQFARATQAARVSLHQILTNVRRGAVRTTWSASQIRLTTATNDDGSGDDDISYVYNTLSKRLTLVTNDNLADADYVLASNVSDMTFSAETGQDASGTACITRVTVYITVKVGNNSITLSGSAAPRRNLVY